MGDRNLYFRLLNNNRQQTKLERPSLRGNYIPKRENGEPFYAAAVYQKNQLQFGGGDKNLFFQLQDKGKVRLIGSQMRRTFNDLEPGSRFIGSLDTTKEQRQATALVTGIQGISSLLNSFLTEPMLDAMGNPVYDVQGNIKVKQKSLTDILTVARDAVREMFAQAQVPVNDTQERLFDTLSVDDSKSILSDAETVISHTSWDESSQEEKKELLSDIVVNEVIENMPDDEILEDDMSEYYFGEPDISESESFSTVPERTESESFRTVPERTEEIKSGDIDPPEEKKYDLRPRPPRIQTQKEIDMEALRNEVLEETNLTGIPDKDNVPNNITSEYWIRNSKQEKAEIIKYLMIRRYKQGLQLRNAAGKKISDLGLKGSLIQNFRRGNTLDLEKMIWVRT